jgi:FlaA1/EpsC-like NDP-sugar epimerase
MAANTQKTGFTWTNKRVLISGVTGFMGSGVSERLVNLNA